MRQWSAGLVLLGALTGSAPAAELVSILPSGAAVAPSAGMVSASDDGRYVLFAATPTTDASGTAVDTLYVRDRVAKTTIAVTPEQLAGTGATISGDGTMVIGVVDVENVPALAWFPLAGRQGSNDAYQMFINGITAPSWISASTTGDQALYATEVDQQRWQSFLDTRSTDTIQGLDRFVRVTPDWQCVALSRNGHVAGILEIVPGTENGPVEDQLVLVNLLNGHHTVLPGTAYSWPSSPDEVSVDGDGSVATYLGFIGSGYGVIAYTASSGTAQRVDASATGQPGNGYVAYPTVSVDGSRVGFISTATNLVPGVTDGAWHAYLKTLSTGAIAIMSVGAAGQPVQASGWIIGNGSGMVGISGSTNVDPAYPRLVGGAYVFSGVAPAAVTTTAFRPRGFLRPH